MTDLGFIERRGNASLFPTAIRNPKTEYDKRECSDEIHDMAIANRRGRSGDPHDCAEKESR